MRVLVTGGAGFIGSNLTKELLHQGHSVTVLDNLSSGFAKNLDGLNAAFVQGDIRDTSSLERAIEGAEVVFHLAASVGNKRSIDDPLFDSDVNVLGTLNVLQAMRKAGSRKIVFSSSAGIFGELKTLPISEDHPLDPDSPYGTSKLCAEKMCLVYTKLYGIEAVALRYFNVYGPNQRFDAYGNVIPIFVFSLLQGKPITIFGDGEQTRDFVNVRDVVQANIRSSVPGVNGVFNIGSNTRITINKLLEDIETAAGSKSSWSYGPPRAGDVRDSLADISKANNAFGFSPAVAMETGLPEYVEWARTEVNS